MYGVFGEQYWMTVQGRWEQEVGEGNSIPYSDTKENINRISQENI